MNTEQVINTKRIALHAYLNAISADEVKVAVEYVPDTRIFKLKALVRILDSNMLLGSTNSIRGNVARLPADMELLEMLTKAKVLLMGWIAEQFTGHIIAPNTPTDMLG